ncbi:hypothetical protein WBG06_00445 [Nocardioides sp. CCNWLW239]|uniref:hypothetical protein n=1 Tax=Nocardioides sp. CCNWLW239 TaxID=3128902 RepID=UPI00301A0193
MPDFTIAPDPALWHEVPDAAGEAKFVAERTAGLEGEAKAVATTMAELALASRGTTGDLTLLLQEPESSLYAVAGFSLYSDREPPQTEQDALELVTGGDIGQWEPTVATVELGAVRGFRVSEFLPAAEQVGSDEDLTHLQLIQSTYVVSAGGRLGAVALTPASSPAAGIVLALIEPVIATWEVSV